MTLNFFSALQNAMGFMLTAYSPAFLAAGLSLALSFGAILIMMTGLTLMFTPGTLNEKVWVFLKVLFFVVLVTSLLRFYNAPAPGIGYSVIGLIESQAGWAMSTLDNDVTGRIVANLEAMKLRLVQSTSVFAIVSGLLYLLLVVVIWIAEFGSLLVVALGLIGEKILVLVGPLFIPFLLVGPLNWMFWGWLKSLVTYAFLPVFAVAWLTVGERFFSTIFAGVPQAITPDQYITWGLYVAGMVLLYTISLILVPNIGASVFSGGVETGSHLLRLSLRR